MQTRTIANWTWLGLAIALLGIPAITTLARLADRTDPLIVAIREFSILGLAALLLVLVVRGERLPLTSIGLRFDRPMRSFWQGILLALALFAGAIACLAAFAALEISYGEGSSFAPSTALMTLTVIRAGIVEEIFFRGFALERIERISGSTTVAVIVTLLAFAAFHFRGGIPGILVAFVLGAILTAYYVWKRDLLAAIIAHFLVDFIPNVLLPLLGINPD